jgi:hypothetical protein
MGTMDQSSEQLPEVPLPVETANTPETGLPTTPETQTPERAQPQRVERGGNTVSQAPKGPPALSLPPVAVPAAPPADNTDEPAADDNSPATANDIDVIEKEWVDKAREIVRQTKDDPYHQEQAVEALQRAYLKKRYNKDLKTPTNAES